ncbi:MAG TPA: DinB family protein [Blastocatellia bacterium]|nr:DinB family protein [Blastocatellia bacterium]
MEIKTIGPFLDYYEKIRQRTRRAIDRIPPEMIDWTYKPGKFTFADLIRHLASIERYMYAENAQLKPSRYPGHGTELADGYENVLAYLERAHQESIEIFSRLSDDDLQKRCQTPGGAEIAVWKWLRAMVEHEIHHRGQIFIYLSMIEVSAAPLYGLTSEEVYERRAR